MANFFKSLLFGEAHETAEGKAQKNFDVLKYDGIKALKIGKTDYAIRCFTEALKIQEDPETLEHLVTAYTRADRTEEAVATASRLLDIEPDNAALLHLRANLNYLIERYPAVIDDCAAATALAPEDPRPHYLAGRAKAKAGDPLGAIVSLSRAITLREGYAEAYLLRAEVMRNAGDLADALEDAGKAVALLPDEEQAYLLRGSIHEALQHPADAERDYRHVLELNPFNEQAYLRLGSLRIAGGDPAGAIALFDEAIELKPDFAAAYNERGRARHLQGDSAGAAEDLKRALELAPDATATPINGTYSNFEDMYKNRPL